MAEQLGTVTRILVADKLGQAGVQILQDAGFHVEVKTGLAEEALCGIVGQFQGLIVRSATTVTRKIIQAGQRSLKLIGRAGVGVDNIDLEAATQYGIVVQNTPYGNITSAAEHAIALLFASARHLCPADKDMKAGKWEKKAYTGVELTGKVLGIIGLGKVGAIVARTAKSLDMKILVYDPYLTERKSQEMGAEKTTLDHLLSQSDFITIHSPLTPETKGLINRERLAKVKKGARIVNTARGGIVVEEDLAQALKEGNIAGAALDVFEQEPLKEGSPLAALGMKIILTPHLGASTSEAQERVAEDIARQFVEFFKDGTIRNAVNLAVNLDPKLEAYGKLCETLGNMCAQMVQAPVQMLKVGFYGRIARQETRALALCGLKGLLSRSTEQPVTLVNARMIAEERGLELVEQKSEQSPNFANLAVFSVVTRDGEVNVSGTCFDDRAPRILQINDFEIDLKPASHLLLMFYPDQPGMVGKFGTIIGEAGINIANMAVGRKQKRGQAVVVLTLDDPATPEVLERLKKAARLDSLYAISL